MRYPVLLFVFCSLLSKTASAMHDDEKAFTSDCTASAECEKKFAGLTVFMGPMWAGKTTALLSAINATREAGKEYIVFKHAWDFVPGTHIVSHTGGEVEAIAAQTVDVMRENIKDSTKVVFVDEAQFFAPEELTSFIEEMDKLGKEVVLAGLDLEFRALPFGCIVALAARAQTYKILRARCQCCGNPAPYTQRLVNGNPAKWTDPIIMPGAENLYEPRCERCYVRPRKEEVVKPHELSAPEGSLSLLEPTSKLSLASMPGAASPVEVSEIDSPLELNPEASPAPEGFVLEEPTHTQPLTSPTPRPTPVRPGSPEGRG